jgi:hypothetical protein
MPVERGSEDRPAPRNTRPESVRRGLSRAVSHRGSRSARGNACDVRRQGRVHRGSAGTLVDRRSIPGTPERARDPRRPVLASRGRAAERYQAVGGRPRPEARPPPPFPLADAARLRRVAAREAHATKAGRVLRRRRGAQYGQSAVGRERARVTEGKSGWRRCRRSRRSVAGVNGPADAGPGAVMVLAVPLATRSSVDMGGWPLSSRPGWDFRPFSEPDHPPTHQRCGRVVGFGSRAGSSRGGTRAKVRAGRTRTKRASRG